MATKEYHIQREEGASGGRYHVTLEGHEAEMTYSKAGTSAIIIDHTFVPRELGGRGIGEAMVFFAVQEARVEQKKIIPLCPFAKAQFDKHEDWRDVLK